MHERLYSLRWWTAGASTLSFFVLLYIAGPKGLPVDKIYAATSMGRLPLDSIIFWWTFGTLFFISGSEIVAYTRHEDSMLSSILRGIGTLLIVALLFFVWCRISMHSYKINLNRKMLFFMCTMFGTLFFKLLAAYVCFEIWSVTEQNKKTAPVTAEEE